MLVLYVLCIFRRLILQVHVCVFYLFQLAFCKYYVFSVVFTICNTLKSFHI